MEEMSLENVNKQLEMLYNEKRYILDRIDNILSLVMPQGVNIDTIKVDGGSRVDKLLKYTQMKEELALDDRLLYINAKISDYENWKKKEIKRLNKYDDLVKLVTYYKEEIFIKDKFTGKIRRMTWEEIAKNCYCSEKTARNKYLIAVESRKKSK